MGKNDGGTYISMDFLDLKKVSTKDDFWLVDNMVGYLLLSFKMVEEYQEKTIFVTRWGAFITWCLLG